MISDIPGTVIVRARAKPARGNVANNFKYHGTCTFTWGFVRVRGAEVR